MRGRGDPSTYMFVAIDGMAQYGCGTPAFREITKTEGGAVRMQVAVQIVQVCAPQEKIYAFLAPEDIPSDPNLTVEVLNRTLQKEEERRGKLP